MLLIPFPAASIQRRESTIRLNSHENGMAVPVLQTALPCAVSPCHCSANDRTCPSFTRILRIVDPFKYIGPDSDVDMADACTLLMAHYVEVSSWWYSNSMMVWRFGF